MGATPQHRRARPAHPSCQGNQSERLHWRIGHAVGTHRQGCSIHREQQQCKVYAKRWRRRHGCAIRTRDRSVPWVFLSTRRTMQNTSHVGAPAHLSQASTRRAQLCGCVAIVAAHAGGAPRSLAANCSSPSCLCDVAKYVESTQAVCVVDRCAKRDASTALNKSAGRQGVRLQPAGRSRDRAHAHAPRPKDNPHATMHTLDPPRPRRACMRPPAPCCRPCPEACADLAMPLTERVNHDGSVEHKVLCQVAVRRASASNAEHVCALGLHNCCCWTTRALLADKVSCACLGVTLHKHEQQQQKQRVQPATAHRKRNAKARAPGPTCVLFTFKT